MAQPITRSTAPSTGDNHTGTLSEHSGMKGGAEVFVVGTGVVVVTVGKLLTLVKMYGCSWNTHVNK